MDKWTTIPIIHSGATLLSAICLFVCRDNLQDDDQFFITREGREIPEHLEIHNNSDVPKDIIDTFSIPHRLFEGSTEWLVASIISALGIIATIIMIKVKHSLIHKHPFLKT